MINDALHNGEIQLQSTTIATTQPDLKSVVPLELSNIDTSSPNVLALGFDASVMMEIVANSMYKDKLIGFQELPANCRDAIIRRREHGDIFTPEVLIKYDSNTHEVSISDNGCGMTREVVEQVYRFFGRSDKRNSATETGMFGVGAKCAFALADEYSISTVSMLTHKKLEFIVTKRGIIITQDEVPTDQEPGTVVSFTVPKNYSIYDIRYRIIRSVSTWLCPVYFVEKGSYKETLSHCTETSLSDIEKGYYSQLKEPATLKYESPEYSFIVNTSRNRIFIGHIPYDFDFDFPVKVDVIMHNQSLITLTATREGLEKDSKYNELTKQLKLKILDILSPEFDKYFKNLPANMSTVSKLNRETIDCFNALKKSNLVKIEDYPYHDFLNRCFDYYTISGDNRQNRYLYDILKNTPVYYTTKKLPKPKRTTTTIYAPEICTKVCIFCPDYNNGCGIDKNNSDLLTTIIKPLPIVPRIKGTSAIRTSLSGVRGVALKNNNSIQIRFEDLQSYTYTTQKFETDKSSIILVTEKQLKRLKSIGCKTIENIEEYKKQTITDTLLETYDGLKVSASLLKNYKIIIYSVSEEYEVELIKLLYSTKKLLILKDEIPKHILPILSKSQKVQSIYTLKHGIDWNDKRTFKVTIEAPLANFEKIFSNIRKSYNKISGVKIIS